MDQAINRRPALLFDGQDDVLRTRVVDFLGQGQSQSDDVTVFVVARPSGSQAPFADILDHNHAGGSGFVLQQNSSNSKAPNEYYFAWHGEGAWQGLGTSSTTRLKLSTTRTFITTILKRGTTQTLFRDGGAFARLPVAQDMDSGPNALTIGGNTSIAGRHFYGLIAEVIVFARALPDGERQAVENYLRHKYQEVPSPSVGGVFGSTLWLQADAGVARDEAGGVQLWADQSGFGQDVTQSEDDQRPQYVEQAINGLPMVRFDGQNDILKSQLIDLLDGRNDASIFVVTRPDAHQAAYANIFDHDHATPAYDGFTLQQGGGGNSYGFSWAGSGGWQGAPWQQAGVTSELEAGSINLTSIVKGGSRQTLYRNGQVSAQFPVSWDMASGDNVLGVGGNVAVGNRNFKGDIAELIVFPTALADAERQSVEAYLRDKYREPGPDALIRNADEDETLFSGNDLYNETGEEQGRAQLTVPNTPAVYILKVQNDDNASHSFKVSGPAGANGWNMRYFDAAEGGNPITAGVTGAGWTLTLSALEARELRMEVTPDESVAATSIQELKVTVARAEDATKKDVVKTTTSLQKIGLLQASFDQGTTWVDVPQATNAGGVGLPDVKQYSVVGFRVATANSSVPWPNRPQFKPLWTAQGHEYIGAVVWIHFPDVTPANSAGETVIAECGNKATVTVKVRPEDN